MDAQAAAALSVEMLPARHGDAILLGWGPPVDRHRLLVDAGPAIAYDAVRTGLAAAGSLDLLVMTHVDADHVEGVILLVNDAGLGITPNDVWFNGWPQLSRELGPVHGEILSALIVQRQLPWNAAFDGAAVCDDAADRLPVRSLAGGLRLTVLGPSRGTLLRLRDHWTEACYGAGLVFGSVEEAMAALRARPRLSPMDSYLGAAPAPDVRELARTRSGTDRSLPNESSIVLLAEHGEQRVLLAGDATPDALLPAVRDLLAQRQRDSLPLDAFKLPHHGSAKNLTAELVRLLPARHYLFSSDGGYYGHPDDAAVATVLEHAPPGAELVFNYATPRSLQWDDERLAARYGHAVRYPTAGSDGVSVRLRPATGRQG